MSVDYPEYKRGEEPWREEHEAILATIPEVPTPEEEAQMTDEQWSANQRRKKEREEDAESEVVEPSSNFNEAAFKSAMDEYNTALDDHVNAIKEAREDWKKAVSEFKAAKAQWEEFISHKKEVLRQARAKLKPRKPRKGDYNELD